MKNFIISILLISCFSMTAFAQTSFGFRTGLNFNTFLGELEEDEAYGTNTGFHIGLAFNQQFTDIWGARAELVYSQKGASNSYEGTTSISLIDRNDRAIPHSGIANINLSTSNTYVDLPLSGYGRITNWLEVSLGVVPGFLVASKGRGDFSLKSETLRTEALELSLDHDYYRDNAGAAGETNEGLITVKDDNTAQELTIPSTLGAYYFQEEKSGSLYNVFNLDAVFGLAFFVNKGLYIGGRVQYGLLDVTNNDADFSFKDFTTSRGDKDVNLVFQGSVGFNF